MSWFSPRAKGRRRWLIFIAFVVCILVGLGLYNLRHVYRAYGLFDQDYYVRTYPDVKRSFWSPFLHYMRYGCRQDRNPSPGFDAKFYRSVYMRGHPRSRNPLLHAVKRQPWEALTRHPGQLRKAVPLPKHVRKDYLAIASMFRNEAPFLKEWIEFHRMMGVTHFYLFNHNSTDNFREVLQPYINAGVVDLFDAEEVSDFPKHRTPVTHAQIRSLEKVLALCQGNTEWLVFLDTDEFLFPVQERNLVAFLKKYEDCAAVSANWQMYGTSGVEKVPKGYSLVETLLWRAPLSHAHHSQVKSIIKPRYVQKACLHFSFLKQGYLQMTEDRVPFCGHVAPSVSVKKLRINHYWSGDRRNFRDKKMQHIKNNGFTVEANALWRLANVVYCQVYDDCIQRFVPELRRRLGHRALGKKNIAWALKN